MDLLVEVDRYKDRIGTFHFKDINLDKMRKSKEEGWTYLEAVKHGLVVNLGSPEGSIDFKSLVEWQKEHGNEGFVCVEVMLTLTLTLIGGYEGFVCVEQETYEPSFSKENMLLNKVYLDGLYRHSDQ